MKKFLGGGRFYKAICVHFIDSLLDKVLSLAYTSHFTLLRYTTYRLSYMQEVV